MLALFAAASLAGFSPQAQADDEPLCVYDVLVDAGKAGRPMPSPTEAMAPCQARYHWDEAASARVRMITIGMLKYQETRRDARDAGVDPAMVEAVFAELTPDQVAAYGMPGSPPPPGIDAAIHAVVAKLMARGLSGDQLKKAHTLLTVRASIANLIADFWRAH